MKHRYLVNGIDVNGNKITSICVSDDILNVIIMYRDRGYSVYGVQKLEQVNINAKIDILILNLFI